MRRITVALATAVIVALLAAAPAGAAGPRPPSRPEAVYVFAGGVDDEVRLAWTRPARPGSHPVLKYVVRWGDGRIFLSASSDQVTVGDLDPGRYVFLVKAVSRAGSSPWARSATVYVD